LNILQAFLVKDFVSLKLTLPNPLPSFVAFTIIFLNNENKTYISTIYLYYMHS